MSQYEAAMLIDSHAHMDMYGNDDLPRALDELTMYRVFTIAVSMDPASYARTKDIAADHPWLLPTFGIHPWRSADWADRLDTLDDLIGASLMLGEIGLDYYWVRDKATYPGQRRTFEYFLQAARQQDKIVNLHTKGAEHDIVDLLRRYAIRRAIVHWYSGPIGAFEALSDLGAYFTVGVEVLTSKKIRRIAQRIPTEQLLTETDNPGGWAWLHDDEPGMPHHLNQVVEALAAVRQTSREEVIETVRANLLRLFEDDSRLAAAAEQVRGG
jgi:TatD DNase family protein